MHSKSTYFLQVLIVEFSCGTMKNGIFWNFGTCLWKIAQHKTDVSRWWQTCEVANMWAGRMWCNSLKCACARTSATISDTHWGMNSCIWLASESPSASLHVTRTNVLPPLWNTRRSACRAVNTREGSHMALCRYTCTQYRTEPFTIQVRNAGVAKDNSSTPTQAEHLNRLAHVLNTHHRHYDNVTEL